MKKILLILCCLSNLTGMANARRIISLNGMWKIAQGDMERIPDRFDHTIPVPGLVDMATPRFDGVGFKSDQRQAFWYQRTFKLNMEKTPDFVILKIHKAKYGTRVFMNNKQVGDHLPCFTPGLFDITDYINPGSLTNTITIRIGADPDAVPGTIPTGYDFEKYKYIPGLYDTVELILTDAPMITNVQIAPDILKETIEVVTELENSESTRQPQIKYTVRKAKTGRTVATHQSKVDRLNANATQKATVEIHIPDCHLWSPEDPFLYELEVKTEKDRVTHRFGMRSFRFDKKTGRAVLNGKPYMMRGTNICILRFFEDRERGYRPWDKNWVRRLHEKSKYMHWNSMRYCIGFPPDFWYDIADEVGFLIQDEFPIWYLGKENWPDSLNSDEIAREYREWMRERWNHASVVIWDAQNETETDETGKAIRMVRHFDLSDRPWDNGWGLPQSDKDCLESHPYLFFPYWRNTGEFHLSDLKNHSGVPGVRQEQEQYDLPFIINEYAWLWLNRDGTPTCLTRNVYKNLLGEKASAQELRYTYARYLAALTEFWRSKRECAAIMHFCILGYSRPGGLVRPMAGATSDHFMELESLNLEPNFEKFVRQSFSPVGLMIDKWDKEYGANTSITVPVVLINDLYSDWQGTVKLSVRMNEKTKLQLEQTCSVESLGQTTIEFQLTMPEKTGEYQLVATLMNGDDEPVQSIRDFVIVEQ